MASPIPEAPPVTIMTLDVYKRQHEDIVEAMAAAERQQRIATGLMAVEVVDQRLRIRGVMTAGVAELRLIGIGHYQ